MGAHVAALAVWRGPRDDGTPLSPMAQGREWDNTVAFGATIDAMLIAAGALLGTLLGVD